MPTWAYGYGDYRQRARAVKGEDLRSSGTKYLAGSNPAVVTACMAERSKAPCSSQGFRRFESCCMHMVTVYFYLLVVVTGNSD